MTAPDAKERWAQRILGGVGARPAGHADPDDEGPQVPVVSPVPPQPAAAPRITDWWRTGRPHIGPDTSEPEKVDDQDADDVDEAEDDEVEEEKPAASGPVPGRPVEKVATDSKGRAVQKKTGVRKHAEAMANDGRLRILAFNGTAAAFGYSLGLVGIFRVYLPAAEEAAVGVFAIVLAIGAAVAAWKILGYPGVYQILPYALISRCLLTALAAEGGRNLAPVPVAYLNEYGEKWDLGPETVSLLITAGGICGALWWLIDRRLRAAHWTVRWFFRVPLASALLACLPYSGTPVV